jgi:hypothetical protein
MNKSLIFVALFVLAIFEESSARGINCNLWATDFGNSQVNLEPDVLGQIFSPLNAQASRTAGHSVWYNFKGCKKIPAIRQDCKPRKHVSGVCQLNNTDCQGAGTDNNSCRRSFFQCVQMKGQATDDSYGKQCGPRFVNSRGVLISGGVPAGEQMMVGAGANSGCMMKHPYADDDRYRDGNGNNVFSDIWCRRDHLTPDIECKCDQDIGKVLERTKAGWQEVLRLSNLKNRLNTKEKLQALLDSQEKNLAACKALRCKQGGTQLNFLDQSVSTSAGGCRTPENIISCSPCVAKLEEFCVGKPSSCFRDMLCSEPDTCQTGICDGYATGAELVQKKTNELASLLDLDLESESDARDRGWSCR